MSKTKLDAAESRLTHCLERWDDPEDLLSVVPGDLRTVLDALRAKARPDPLEQQLIRAALDWYESPARSEADLRLYCEILRRDRESVSERAKAKKGGRK